MGTGKKVNQQSFWDCVDKCEALLTLFVCYVCSEQKKPY